jgi:hypothetical protein
MTALYQTDAYCFTITSPTISIRILRVNNYLLSRWEQSKNSLIEGSSRRGEASACALKPAQHKPLSGIILQTQMKIMVGNTVEVGLLELNKHSQRTINLFLEIVQ